MKFTANELRIGNIVTVENRYHPQLKGINLKVTGISEGLSRDADSVKLVSLDGWMATYNQGIEFIKPVKLTEKRLLEYGFSDKDYKDDYIGIGVKAGSINTDFVLVKPDGENYKYFTFEYSTGGVPFYIELEFIHELQNLFFTLTGKELEINLK
jgi:hypothetical protein